MKSVSILLACLCAAFLMGCAVAERDATEVGTQIQDGLQGRGRIVERDPTADAFGQEFR